MFDDLKFWEWRVWHDVGSAVKSISGRNPEYVAGSGDPLTETEKQKDKEMLKFLSMGTLDYTSEEQPKEGGNMAIMLVAFLFLIVIIRR